MIMYSWGCGKDCALLNSWGVETKNTQLYANGTSVSCRLYSRACLYRSLVTEPNFLLSSKYCHLENYEVFKAKVFVGSKRLKYFLFAVVLN